MGGRQMLDPRWHWMRDTLAKMYAQLDDDAIPVAMAVTAACGSELLLYATERGYPQIERRVITDVDAMADAAVASTVDVSAEDVTG